MKKIVATALVSGMALVGAPSAFAEETTDTAATQANDNIVQDKNDYIVSHGNSYTVVDGDSADNEFYRSFQSNRVVDNRDEDPQFQCIRSLGRSIDKGFPGLRRVGVTIVSDNPCPGITITSTAPNSGLTLSTNGQGFVFKTGKNVTGPQSSVYVN